MEKQKIIVTAVPWSVQAADMLAAAVLSCSVEDYRQQVEEGAVLFEVSTADGVQGFYILRVDTWAEKTIGVLVAAAGKPGFHFADELMPVIESQFKDCHEIHQYCSRPGMAKKLARSGWEPTHLVMRKIVKNG